MITKTENLFIGVLAVTTFITVFSFVYTDNETELAPITSIDFIEPKLLKVSSSDFWSRVHEIESASGRIRYQGNDKNCNTTKRFCGHFQIGYQALKDIGCTTKQCFKDRDNYHKSLAMAKKILEKKLRRYHVSEDWLKYALYQQGARGVKTMHLASKGKYKFKHIQYKRMARNSIYTIKELKLLGSRKAAISYLNLWRVKWEDTGRKIVKL